MSTVDLRLGDCLEILPTLADKSVDAVITDPPYGVGFRYGTYDDTREGYEQWVLRCFAEMQRVARVVIVTPGIGNMFIYPRPKWVCGWFKPGSTRRNGTGGFNEWEPVLVYADKLKFMTDALRLPDIANHSEVADHPCPKPLRLFSWLVENSKADTVLDPFMGSGTTGKACIQLGRNFIGIEVDPGYFGSAKRRIEEAQMQMVMEFK